MKKYWIKKMPFKNGYVIGVKLTDKLGYHRVFDNMHDAVEFYRA